MSAAKVPLMSMEIEKGVQDKLDGLSDFFYESGIQKASRKKTLPSTYFSILRTITCDHFYSIFTVN